MPELPDVEVYVDALRRHTLGRPLRAFRLWSPFLLRTVTPTPAQAVGSRVENVHRLGKQIVIAFENGIHFVMHLMIAGRLRWKPLGTKAPGRTGLAALDFEHGTLAWTEAGSKKRASLHVVPSADAVEGFRRSGIEPLEATPADFRAALTARNHTLKRALTDPDIVAGIGNAYSDEILHHARLSPLTWTTRLNPEETARLHEATQQVLTHWLTKLRAQVATGFPDRVTAFREGMAVHGRFGKPCPSCGSPVQRIRRAENEANYCATCQTGGKLLADRGLSRLLGKDWPRSFEELDQRRADLLRD